MSRVMAMLVLAILVAVGMPALAGHPSKESGTVTSIDPAARTITLDEMGPWHGPRTATTRHSIVFTPSTRIELVTRSKRPVAGGWPGGYVDSSLSAADVHPGDFVTVEVTHEHGGPVATSIDVVRGT
jgi:hypothetical protein